MAWQGNTDIEWKIQYADDPIIAAAYGLHEGGKGYRSALYHDVRLNAPVCDDSTALEAGQLPIFVCV